MTENCPIFVIVTHLSGTFIGCQNPSNDESLHIKGALELSYSPDNLLVMSPVLPRGVEWDIPSMREAETMFSLSHTICYTSIPLNDANEMCRRYNEFWLNEQNPADAKLSH